MPVSTKVKTTKGIDAGSDSLQLPSSIQTPPKEDWRCTGARPKDSGVTQSQAATSVTSSTNARPTATQQK